jgi:hypothetical protein
LVHPVDDLGPNNPASHPELFEELSAYFVDTHYDLKNLLRTLANTEAYQRSSQAAAEGTPPRPELFTSMAVKVLTAEQLYDSLSRCLSTAGGNGEEASPVNRGYDGRRQAFIARMQSQSRDATEYNGGLQQALNLMNGGEVSEATDLGRSALLTSLEAPFFSDQSRIEILFLATLSRFPSEAESAGFQDYLARSEELYHQQAEGLRGPVSGGAATDEGVDPPAPETGLLPEMATTQLALSDILWALLNSSEFALNHKTKLSSKSKIRNRPNVGWTSSSVRGAWTDEDVHPMRQAHGAFGSLPGGTSYACNLVHTHAT